jgi:hypothetical protein
MFLAKPIRHSSGFFNAVEAAITWCLLLEVRTKVGGARKDRRPVTLAVKWPALSEPAALVSVSSSTTPFGHSL